MSAITVTGLAELQLDVQRLAAALEEPGDLMRALAGILESQVELRLELKRDPEGRAWAPLAQSTLERYQAEDTVQRGPQAGTVRRRGTLLERTGQMRNSLSSASGDDWAEVGMSRLTPDGRWQVPMLHEFGTTRMPRRGLFFADPEEGTLGQADEQALADEVDDWLWRVFPA